MKYRMSPALLGVLLLALLPLKALADPDQRLREWLDARYEEELAFSPMAQAKLGRKQQYDQLDDFSEAALDAELQWQLETAETLRDEFDPGALSAESRQSYEFWLWRAEQARAIARWRRHQYVFDQVSGRHTALPEFMVNYHRVDSVQDMRDYIDRLEAIERALGQLQDRARGAASDGIRPPRFAYDIVIAQSRKVISGEPFDASGGEAPLWSDILAKTAALREAGLVDAGGERELREAARKALLEHVKPGYERLVTWLEADRQHSDEQPQGVGSLPDGDAYYAHRLQRYTTSGMDASAVHQLGLEEVARIREEMEHIMERVGFKGDLQAFFEFVRSDEQFYYPDTPEGRQAFIDETRHYLEKIEALLPQYFGILPRARLEVRRVEAFRERDGAAAFYQSGTADGTRPGVYYMHLSDMQANNRTDLQTTAYHEGSPGHHMQGSIALEREDLPLFRTDVWYSAYGEAWALYAERLAWEMGVYDNPYYDFGRLGAEIFRAIRLVVDTGLHAMGWSQERAVQYMLNNSAKPETSVRSEICRYLVWPGQATSYKVGMQKILALRERAREALGDRFDIRGFHDTVLGGGALPLDLLERRVEEWVATRR